MGFILSTVKYMIKKNYMATKINQCFVGFCSLEIWCLIFLSGLDFITNKFNKEKSYCLDIFTSLIYIPLTLILQTWGLEDCWLESRARPKTTDNDDDDNEPGSGEGEGMEISRHMHISRGWI